MLALILRSYYSKRVIIPDKDKIKTEIERLGYKSSEHDWDLEYNIKMAIMTNSKMPDNRYLSAVVDDVDASKNENMTISVRYVEYESLYDAFENYLEYYTYADVIQKNESAGTIKTNYNDVKTKGYVLYDFKKTERKSSSDILEALDESWKKSTYGWLDTSSGYLYGGFYIDGKRVLHIVTTDPMKIKEVEKSLSNLKLPRP